LVNFVGAVDVLDILLVGLVVLLEGDVAGLGLDGFLEFTAELLKNSGKVTFLFSFANTPIFRSELFHEWLVDLVHDRVE
jgi:hypothetical protein